MVQSVHQPTRYLMKVDSEMGELRAFTFISEASFNCQMTRYGYFLDFLIKKTTKLFISNEF